MGECVLLCTYRSLTIPYCTSSGTVHGRLRLDNFILILLELRARHRQSGCVIGCRALASVGTTCLLHKIPCTPGLAKRSGSPPICSLR
jgi:hypothetical protein